MGIKLGPLDSKCNTLAIKWSSLRLHGLKSVLSAPMQLLYFKKGMYTGLKQRHRDRELSYDFDQMAAKETGH